VSNGWIIGVSKRGLDGRRSTEFYDVAIGDFDQAIGAVRALMGKAREVHVWIREPLQDWRIANTNLRNGEIRSAGHADVQA
jgi:hypothetical protein